MRKNIEIEILVRDSIIRSCLGRVAYCAFTACFIILKIGFMLYRLISSHGSSVKTLLKVDKVYYSFSKLFEEAPIEVLSMAQSITSWKC